MSEEKTIVATDLEDFDEVDVIEILVSEGEAVEVNQSIVTLESDKAMMEFPASSAGTVKSISVNVGDKIKQGDPLLVLSIDSEGVDSNEKNKNTSIKEHPESAKDEAEEVQIKDSSKEKQRNKSNIETDRAYASPSVRKYANELGVNIKITSGPVLDKPGDLAGLLTNLEENDVLFIDEIHRLSPVVEEFLYSAMEDYKIDIMIDTMIAIGI